MTQPDPSRPHILAGPYGYDDGAWWGGCSCGAEFLAGSEQEIRDAGQPHRMAQRDRLGGVYDAERENSRRVRREQRRAGVRARGSR